MDPSPYYDNIKEPQFDESEAIELPADDSNGDPRKYPYGQSPQYGPASGNSRNRINRYYHSLKPYYVLDNENDGTLIFESRFESGNLRRAVLVGENTYNLFLKYDYQTTTYT